MSEYGRFLGTPKTEWLVDPDGPDRDMRLLENFTYIDPSGQEWRAARGSVVDGASIPRPLWSSVGSPYTDDYRCASIVHDVACKDPEIPRKEADRMFYWACLAGGCSIGQASLLYAGVRVGAWALLFGGWSAVERDELLYRLPDERRRDEQEIVDRYRDAALEIRNLGDAPTFQDVDEIVERKLAQPPA